jgi:hypothetical protein
MRNSQRAALKAGFLAFLFIEETPKESSARFIGRLGDVRNGNGNSILTTF